MGKTRQLTLLLLSRPRFRLCLGTTRERKLAQVHVAYVRDSGEGEGSEWGGQSWADGSAGRLASGQVRARGEAGGGRREENRGQRLAEACDAHADAHTDAHNAANAGRAAQSGRQSPAFGASKIPSMRLGFRV